MPSLSHDFGHYLSTIVWWVSLASICVYRHLFVNEWAGLPRGFLAELFVFTCWRDDALFLAHQLPQHGLSDVRGESVRLRLRQVLPRRLRDSVLHIVQPLLVREASGLILRYESRVAYAHYFIDWPAVLPILKAALLGSQNVGVRFYRHHIRVLSPLGRVGVVL